MMLASMQFLNAKAPLNNNNDSMPNFDDYYDDSTQNEYTFDELVADYSKFFDDFTEESISEATGIKEIDFCQLITRNFKLEFQVDISKWIIFEYSKEKKRFSIVTAAQDGFHLTNPGLETMIDQITGGFKSLGKVAEALKHILLNDIFNGLYISFDKCVGALLPNNSATETRICETIGMKDVNTPDELSMALIEILTNLERNFVNKFNQNPDNSEKQLTISDIDFKNEIENQLNQVKH